MPAPRKMPFQICIALDQLANALTGGWADETFSARCWRLREKSRFWSLARRVVDAVFFFDPGHCRTSYESERQRNHLAPSMRPEQEK